MLSWPIHDMKVYGGLELRLDSFSTSALDEGKCLASLSPPGKEPPLPIEQKPGLAP